MSAFFVGVDHVNAMLTVAATVARTRSLPSPDNMRRSPDDATLTLIGQHLIRENIASLQSRYPTSWSEIVDCDPDSFRYVEDGFVSVRPDIFKLGVNIANCYEYQSCEHEDWEASFSHRFSTWLIGECAKKLAGEITDGWEYHKPKGRFEPVSLSRLATRR